MKTHHTSSGYILLLTLSIITLSIIIITALNNRISGYLPFMHLTIERQKAHTLAFGGIQLGLSQLATAARGTQKEKPTEVDHAKELLLTLLPIHNQWQTFTLTKQADGFDGELKICITSESGKININNVYDFKAKKFLSSEGQSLLRQGSEGQGKDYKKIMGSLFERLTPMVQGIDLFKGFEKFLKERSEAVQDVTELLLIKEFELFKNNVFYRPYFAEASSVAKAREDGSKGKLVTSETSTDTQVYLTDLFTIWTEQATIDPWLLSYSLAKLCKAEQPKKTKERETLNDLLKNFTIKTEWNAQTWDAMIMPLYGISFQSLPEFVSSNLNDTFKPTIFSVLSYAKVGTITQRLLAIVQRDASAKDSGAAFGVRIKKLYWL